MPGGCQLAEALFREGLTLGRDWAINYTEFYGILTSQQPQHDALPGHSLVLDNIHPEYPPHISNQQEVKINH